MKSPQQAQLDGYATFNRGPHLCIDAPNGHFTISVRTSEGKMVTMAFVPYSENGPPQCMDVQYHSSGVVKQNGSSSSPVQAVIGFTTGSNVFRSTLEDEKPCTLLTVLLNQKQKENIVLEVKNPEYTKLKNKKVKWIACGDVETGMVIKVYYSTSLKKDVALVQVHEKIQEIVDCDQLEIIEDGK